MLNGPVVVGYDKTPHSDRALVEAAHEAAERGTALTIVHALPHPASLLEVDAEPLRRKAAEQAVEAGAERIRAQYPDLQVEGVVRPGEAAEVLSAASRGADLLVVGHGERQPGRPLRGSVALRVLAEACCPVLVVRGDGRRVRGRVLVVVDIDESCDDLLRFAFTSAAGRGADLVAVNVWDEPWVIERAETGYTAADADGADAIGADRANHLERLIQPWRTDFPGVQAMRQTSIGPTGPVLAEASQRADLLVVGAHRHGGDQEGMRVGPVANAVLHHSRCPVAVVPLD